MPYRAVPYLQALMLGSSLGVLIGHCLRALSH